MSQYDDKPMFRYITYMKDDDDYYYIDLFNKDGTLKKRKSFSTEKALQNYERYLDLKDEYKKNNITEDEFKEYELYLRNRFIINHYNQFSKLNPYGRYKTISKIYNLKYNFNVSDNAFKLYLRDNFNL